MATVSSQTVVTGDIDSEVIDIYKRLMATSTEQDSVYIKAKETMQDIFKDGTIKANEKAGIMATMLSQLTTNISTQAMNMAFQIAKHNQEAPYTLAKISEETKAMGKEAEKIDADIALKEQQLADMVRQHDEDAGKWAINELILQNQKSMSDVDTTYKPLTSAEDLTIKQKQIESMVADIAFNEAKKTIMEWTRKDNVRMKATEQYAEFLKYISAADVVPGNHHFDNLVGLVRSIVEGVDTPDNQYVMVDKPADATNVVAK